MLDEDDVSVSVCDEVSTVLDVDDGVDVLLALLEDDVLDDSVVLDVPDVLVVTLLELLKVLHSVRLLRYSVLELLGVEVHGVISTTLLPPLFPPLLLLPLFPPLLLPPLLLLLLKHLLLLL